LRTYFCPKTNNKIEIIEIITKIIVKKNEIEAKLENPILLYKIFKNFRLYEEVIKREVSNIK
jgi:hypothetical protein